MKLAACSSLLVVAECALRFLAGAGDRGYSSSSNLSQSAGAFSGDEISQSSKPKLPGIAPSQSRFAVFRPFWGGDLKKLAMLSRGQIVEPRACTDPLPIDLVLYYYGNASDAVGDDILVGGYLQQMVKTMPMVRCFAHVELRFADLDPHMPYPQAPCAQFTHLFYSDPPAWGYDAVYQMEFDVTPLRPNWLHSLMPIFEEVAAGKAWVVGGGADYRCLLNATNGRPAKQSDVLPKDLAINGNAVYSTGSSFVKLVRDYGRKCHADGDYDIELSRLYNQTGHWKSSGLFKNCKYPPFASRSSSQIASLFPDAAFAHKRD